MPDILERTTSDQDVFAPASLAPASGDVEQAPRKKRSMGSHQSARMKEETWLTPRPIIEALGTFDLDPCTPIDMPWETARHRYTIVDDGLTSPWFGRVWLNPPYSNKAVQWMRKLVQHGEGTALIFARTETAWFFESVWDAPTAKGVLFLRGRLHFHHRDGRRAEANAGAPSALVTYGDRDAELLRTSGIDGHFVPLNHN